MREVVAAFLLLVAIAAALVLREPWSWVLLGGYPVAVGFAINRWTAIAVAATWIPVERLSHGDPIGADWSFAFVSTGATAALIAAGVGLRRLVPSRDRAGRPAPEPGPR